MSICPTIHILEWKSGVSHSFLSKSGRRCKFKSSNLELQYVNFVQWKLRLWPVHDQAESRNVSIQSEKEYGEIEHD
jgi:hypothetical protein